LVPQGLPLLKTVSEPSLKLLLSPMSGTGVVADIKKTKEKRAAAPTKKPKVAKAKSASNQRGGNRAKAAQAALVDQKPDSLPYSDEQSENLAAEADVSLTMFSDFLAITVAEMKAVTSANTSAPA
jgi:hypothetical protein